MSALNDVRRPRTQRTKRFLVERQPKLIENPKSLLILKDLSCSAYVHQILKELHLLKHPLSLFFHKKRSPVKPMEDDSKLEYLCKKNDRSLFLIGSSTKKRPACLTFGRMYDFHSLDMVEFEVDTFESMDDFETEKCVTGNKPALLFVGDQFETDDKWRRIKNLFADFWRGEDADNVCLQGVQHVLMFTVVPELPESVAMRSYRIRLKKSGSRVPRVELEPMGPHLDLRLLRSKLASDDHFRLACRVPKQLLPKKVKNVERDKLGSTFGRIHMQTQNLDKLQLRKVKALKRSAGDAQLPHDSPAAGSASIETPPARSPKCSKAQSRP